MRSAGAYKFVAPEKSLTLTLVVAATCALGLSGCGSDEKDRSSSSSTTVETVTQRQLSADEVFERELKSEGILPTAEQLPLVIPSAKANCDAIRSTTLPYYLRFEKMVELSQILGAGKSIFEYQSTAEGFMKASIAAYCPDQTYLIPQ